MIILLKDAALTHVQPGMDASGVPGSGRGELGGQFNGKPVTGKPVQKSVGAKLLEVAPPKAIDTAEDQVVIFPVELWERLPPPKTDWMAAGRLANPPES